MKNSQLISQINNVYSSGQGAQGFDSLTAANTVGAPAAALNNTASTGLAFTPKSGSFLLQVTQKSTGQVQTTQVNIDLTGSASDTTLTDVAAQINGAGNVSASITADGRLKISSDSRDFSFGFADDSSGTLSALGLNTYFTGKDATDIGVNSVVLNDPALLAAGRGNVPGDNSNATALAAVVDTPQPGATVSLRQTWLQHTEDMATRTGAANQLVSSTGVVSDGLESQRQSISGVSIDQESIDMLTYQRAFEGSARFITVVDQMTQTLLAMVH